MRHRERTLRANRIHNGSRVFNVLLIVILVALCIVFLYPFINIIAISLSSSKMIGSGTITWFPKEFNPRGYQLVFGKGPIYRAYLNTAILCFAT